jgi:hypothetical protein
MAVYYISVPLSAWADRVRLAERPTAEAVLILFCCLERVADERAFLGRGSCVALVRDLRRLETILRHALWRGEGPDDAYARSVLRSRCRQAADTVETLLVWLALPAKTTHRDLLDLLCSLLAALVSGRLDELPREPQRARKAWWSRILFVLLQIRSIIVGAIPLGVVFLLQRNGIMLPDGIRDGVYIAAVLWLVVALVAAFDEVRPARVELFGALASALIPGRGR